MELNFEEKLAVVQTAQSHGHQAIIRLFRAKLEGLTQALLVPQANVDEDIRLLQLWRGHNMALYFLEGLPRLIQAETEKQQQAGTFSVSPTQPSLFGIAGEDTPDIMESANNPAFGPKPMPAAHPLNYR